MSDIDFNKVVFMGTVVSEMTTEEKDYAFKYLIEYFFKTDEEKSEQRKKEADEFLAELRSYKNKVTKPTFLT